MFEKMSEILGFAVLEKSTNVRLQTIRKEDMEIKKIFLLYFTLQYCISFAIHQHEFLRGKKID